MYLKTRIFSTTGYARVLLFMFIRRELGGTVQDVYFSFNNVRLSRGLSGSIICKSRFFYERAEKHVKRAETAVARLSHNAPPI